MKVTSVGLEPIQFITALINARTHRRVQDLKVEIENHKPEGELPVLKIAGRVPSYYVKQLAQHGAMEAISQDGKVPYVLANNITVST